MFSKEEVQYITDAMHSHVTANGLRAGTMWMVILSKLQAAAGDQVIDEGPKENLEVAAEKDN